MARMVATKAALSIRVDALTDADGKSEPQAPSIGIENRAKLESRLRALEHQGELNGVRRFADGGKKQQAFRMTGETKVYNSAADVVDLVSTQREPMEMAVKAVLDVKEEKRRAKEERRAKKRAEKESREVDEEMEIKEEEPTGKKEKKRKRRDDDVGMDVDETKVSYVQWFLNAEIDDRAGGGGRDGSRAESSEKGTQS
jgi:nucleolar protein 58